MTRSLIFMVAVMLVSGVSMASGSSSGGFGGNSSTQARQTQVDEAYELGKSIYNGRYEGITEVDYCVMTEGEAKSIRSSNLKALKGTSYSELAAVLVNCDEPEKTVLNYMDSDSAVYVLYYIGERYRLDLDRS